MKIVMLVLLLVGVLGSAYSANMGDTGIYVKREKVDWGYVQAITYTQNTGSAMLRATGYGAGGFALCRSEDNGKTWSKPVPFKEGDKVDDNRIVNYQAETFYLDPDNGALLLIYGGIITSIKPTGIEYADNKDVGPRTRKLYYSISKDGGITWSASKQFIEKGYNSQQWSKYTEVGKSTFVVEAANSAKMSDGKIMLMGYIWPSDDYFKDFFKRQNWPDYAKNDWPYHIVSLAWNGSWKDGDIEWVSQGLVELPGGLTNAGTCGSDEPTFTILPNGNIFTVMRTSTGNVPLFKQNHIPVLPYRAVSSDKGKTWKQIQPFTYTDGLPVFTPSSISRFFHSTKNGKTYFIGNLLNEPDYGTCAPRTPLAVAQFDNKKLSLMRGTQTNIEAQTGADPGLAWLSNFRTWEDRQTKDLMLVMSCMYFKPGTGWLESLPESPTYVYRITLPK